MATKTGEPWTDDDVATLDDLWNDLVPDDEIAAKLGRTVRAVAIKRCKLGLTSRDCKRATTASELTSDEMIAELQKRGFVCTLASSKLQRSTAIDRIPSASIGAGL
jgi:hypothetical protein